MISLLPFLGVSSLKCGLQMLLLFKKLFGRCELFLKLFLVMGITWIFQVILSIVENDESKETLLSVLYAIFDMVNLFQAIAIFVIFVCKRETLRALEIKYPCLKSKHIYLNHASYLI